ncbi:putative step ii splicing factor [Cryptosporidium felis]|nr:putative step ii splicing factor [Cryptosporidium felis]
MNIQKISNKASVFLNHKHFHPGNSKNREKVWLAEEKLKEEERRQEELLKRRKKEWEIEELRRDLRQSQKRSKGTVDAEARAAESFQEPNKLFQDIFSGESKNPRPPVRSELYEEDYYIGNHSTIWGSFYDPESKRWGFRCCRSTEFNSLCPGTRKKSMRSKLKSKTQSSTNSHDPELLHPPYRPLESNTSGSKSTKEQDLDRSSHERSRLISCGKPFSKQSKGISDLVNILMKPQDEYENKE